MQYCYDQTDLFMEGCQVFWTFYIIFNTHNKKIHFPPPLSGINHRQHCAL